MAAAFSHLVTSWLLPPGLFVLLFAAVAILCLVPHDPGPSPGARRARRFAAILALAAGTLLYAGSLPLGAGLLARTLEGSCPLPSLQDLKQADCLVVLGGGAESFAGSNGRTFAPSRSTLARLAAAAALQRRLSGRALPILICGGPPKPGYPAESRLAAGLLADLGLSPQLLITEEKSSNTWENARNGSELLRSLGFARPVLVSSALHLRRAELSFRSQGVSVIPYPCDFRGGWDGADPADFLPDAGALDLLRDTLHEYLGLAAYAMRR
jgi:uncharacterized SAM-binding protein YcdF (DUF218 family)